MLNNDREKYEQFFKAFGRQLKYGLYMDYGAHKDLLQDLVLFGSSFEDKKVTLKEYVSRMKDDQKKIYYASGDTAEQIKLLPQVEAVVSRGYEVLYLTEDVDEFALQMLRTYSEKEFANVCQDDLDLSSDEEKEALKKENEECADMLAFMKESIGDTVKSVRLSNSLKNHPASLSSEGMLSISMEKTLNKMPGKSEGIKADLVLEINAEHPIAERLRTLYESDRDTLAKYSRILYAGARLINGLTPENPSETADLICDLMLG